MSHCVTESLVYDVTVFKDNKVNLDYIKWPVLVQGTHFGTHTQLCDFYRQFMEKTSTGCLLCSLECSHCAFTHAMRGNEICHDEPCSLSPLSDMDIFPAFEVSWVDFLFFFRQGGGVVGVVVVVV